MIDELSLQNLIPANVGSVERFAELVRVLHHQFLEWTISSRSGKLEREALAKLLATAELLATHYTNPNLDERAEEVSRVSDTESSRRYDALTLAGTIFEYLGDFASIEPGESDERLALRGNDFQTGIPRANNLYLKAALTYSLARLGSRSTVLLDGVLKKLARQPSLTAENTELFANYLGVALISGKIDAVRFSGITRDDITGVASQLDSWAKKAFADGYVSSLEAIAVARSSLFVVEACLRTAFAFVDGDESLLRLGQQNFSQAVAALQAVREAETTWNIRTLARVVRRLWSDSPWMRLRPAINNKAYLRGLVTSGVMSLWPSQIEALEMSADLPGLNAGYLDPRVKRAVISMPTSAGKTLLCELAIVSSLEQNPGTKCVYVATTRALCDQVVASLKKRLAGLGIRIAVPVSDSDMLEYESLLFSDAGVIVVTQEKLSYLLRQSSPAVLNARLFIFDEVHNISAKGRGVVYEQVISLLMTSPETSQAKMLFLSAVMPNHEALREWVDPEAIGSSIASRWRPTAMLKGALVFRRPSITPGVNEYRLAGDVMYVRRRDDINSPLRLEGVVESRQIVNWPAEYGGNFPVKDSSASDGQIQHAARLAARYARIGPVLVYGPTLEIAMAVIRQILDDGVDLRQVSVTPRQADSVQFLHEVLPADHLLSRALDVGLAFHHGQLAKDVRSEIEALFAEGYIRILAATPTLIEGVNLPVKTLILADWATRRFWDQKQKKIIEVNPMSKRDFVNICGRAGRALHETEGQVLLIEPLNGFPKTSDRRFGGYLDITEDDPDLAIHSAMTADTLAMLEALVETIDGDEQSADALIFDNVVPEQFADIQKLVKQLEALSVFADSGIITLGDGTNTFAELFSRTLSGFENPDIAPRVLTRFANSIAAAANRRISQAQKAMFARTGLDLSTCVKMWEATVEFWARYSHGLDAPETLTRDIIEKIGDVIYSAAGADLEPFRYTKSPKGRKKIEVGRPSSLLADWISEGSSAKLITDYFQECSSAEHAADQCSRYIGTTLNYATPWLLSAFWSFSKEVLEGNPIAETPLSRDIALLPAYAKFGVDSPCAALASTLGISPNYVARQLSALYDEVAGETYRYDFKMMIAWLRGLETDDLAREFEPRNARRIIERLDVLSSDQEPRSGSSTWTVSFGIAGWRYYDGEAVLSEAHGSNEVVLRPVENSFDENAVAVLAADGRMMGYVPRSLSAEVRARITGERAAGKILAVRDDPNPNMRVIVSFDGAPA